MIETFLLCAAILVLAASALLLVPLLRKRADDQRMATGTAIVSLVVLLLGSGALYVFWSKYDWSESASADTPAAEAAGLAKELASKPDAAANIDDWLRLARMYEKLGQLPLASRAYQRVDRLSNGTNSDALIGMADMLVSRSIESLRGQAGHLYERAIEIDPRSVRAWMFAGVAAIQRGELPLARQRIAQVLTLNPDPELRALAERFVTGLDAQMAGQDPVAAAAAGGKPASPATSGANSPRIAVRVTLAPALAAKVPAGALLFVAARDPANPGPPFAAKRLAARFPIDIELTPADAMMPSRQIEAGRSYSVVARVALGGTPTASSGDPFGQVGYHVGKDGRLNIVIDQISP